MLDPHALVIAAEQDAAERRARALEAAKRMTTAAPREEARPIARAVKRGARVELREALDPPGVLALSDTA